MRVEKKGHRACRGIVTILDHQWGSGTILGLYAFKDMCIFLAFFLMAPTLAHDQHLSKNGLECGGIYFK